MLKGASFQFTFTVFPRMWLGNATLFSHWDLTFSALGQGPLWVFYYLSWRLPGFQTYKINISTVISGSPYREVTTELFCLFPKVCTVDKFVLYYHTNGNHYNNIIQTNIRNSMVLNCFSNEWQMHCLDILNRLHTHIQFLLKNLGQCRISLVIKQIASNCRSSDAIHNF